MEEFDDAHLLPERRKVAEDKNGFVELEKVVASVSEDDWDDERTELRKLWKGDGEDGDLVAAAKIIEKRKELFELFDVLLEKPHLQFPPVENIYDPTSEVFQLLSLSTYLRARVRVHASRGEWKEAVEGLEPLLVLGNRTIEGEGGLIHYLVGAAIVLEACGEMESFLSSPEFPVNLVPRLFAILELTPDHEAAGDLVWKNEYRMLANITRDFSNGLGVQAIQAIGLDLERDRGWAATLKDCAGQVGMAFLFQPNMTRRDMATFFQHYRKLTELPPHRRKEVKAPELLERVEHRDVFGARGVNWIGNVLLQLALPQLESAVFRSDLVQSNVEALQILCALRQYEAREQKLPAALSDLVPGDLKELPRDRFSGKRFSYSAEERRFWSVGMDGIDQGGANDARSYAASRRGQDLTMPLRWLAEE